MARRPRLEVEGGLYHLITRGLSGQTFSLTAFSVAIISRRHDAALSRLKHAPDLQRQISKVIKWVN